MFWRRIDGTAISVNVHLLPQGITQDTESFKKRSLVLVTLN